MFLTTPLSRRNIKRLRIGDIVYLSGIIFTARDKAHERAMRDGDFPVSLRGGVIFHSGPIVKKEKNGFRVVAIGPTTSSRMNFLESEFLKKFQVRGIIGKGGMSPGVLKGKAVYLSMTGGCAAITADSVKRVRSVHWLDLGIPEAVFELEVKNLGPLVVAIDFNGNSLYEEVDKRVNFYLKK